MPSRRIIGLIAAIAVAVIGILVVVVILRRGNESPRGEIDRWANREILLPGAAYQLPKVDEELLEPRFYYFVDPSKPLSSEIVDELEPDLPDALRDHYTRSVENELEALLFEE